jgi:hypothetical protein
MFHVQVVSRNEENLQTLIREAIADGRIRSLQTDKVKGGLRITHKRFLGAITLQRTRGPLLATVACKNKSKEWQLLEAFVGRLAYHFREEIAAINIQMDSVG